MIDIEKVVKYDGRLHINEAARSFRTKIYGRMQPYTPTAIIFVRHYSNIIHIYEVFNYDK